MRIIQLLKFIKFPEISRFSIFSLFKVIFDNCILFYIDVSEEKMILEVRILD